MQMVENFQHKGHHLYMDNFYTSPSLFLALWEVGIGACGTLRCNRVGVPSSIKNNQKMKKGDIITEKDSNLLFVKWKDKREVTILTTIHDDSIQFWEAKKISPNLKLLNNTISTWVVLTTS